MLVRVKKGRDASFFVDKQVQGDGIFLHMDIITKLIYKPNKGIIFKYI